MLDQLRFSPAMLDLDALSPRYLSLVRDLSADDKRAVKMVDHVLRHGEMAPGDAAMVLQVSPRIAQSI